MLTMIATDRLHPHPNNPRKKVGDVTELAESIKANGILQALTVVPRKEGGYTVIIGHRRLAAAKLAGLDEVPCAIADMTEEEQLATMLTENMQRTDLTIYEQAKAFQQLSIDFEMSVQEISELSGFSESTVRRRTKLAEIEEKDFKTACDRGATLFDFAELDKIENEEDKARCIKALGTNNFKNEVKSALEKQKTRAKMARWAEQLDKFATRIAQVNYVNGRQQTEIGGEYVHMDYFRNYGSWTRDEDVFTPQPDTEYYYTVSDMQISVYRKHNQDDEEERRRAKQAEIREQAQAEWEEMQEICERHKDLRREFIVNYGNAKSNLTTIMKALADGMLSQSKHTGYYSGLDTEELSEMLRVPYIRGEGPEAEGFTRMKDEQPERLMLIMAYWYLENRHVCCSRDWNAELQRYVINYHQSNDVERLYDYLSDLGYEMSDEEIEIVGGTHELYYKEEK